MRSSKFWLWVIVSLLWAGAISYLCFTAWPHISLDLAKDPATIAAYNQAVMFHAARYAAIALVPPLLLLGLGRAVLRS